jgi:hypothetical protein
VYIVHGPIGLVVVACRPVKEHPTQTNVLTRITICTPYYSFTQDVWTLVATWSGIALVH